MADLGRAVKVYWGVAIISNRFRHLEKDCYYLKMCTMVLIEYKSLLIERKPLPTGRLEFVKKDQILVEDGEK